MSTLSVATIKSQSSSPPTIKNTSGTEVGTFCRAWVNFNGTGTVAIRASFNVSSITDDGVGTFTINFTTSLPDANYAICGFSIGTSSSTTGLISARDTFSPAVGSCQIVTTRTDTMAAADQAHVHLAIFR